MSLKGKTALVTGGGRGIGRAVAVRLAQDGARVAVTARSADQLAEVAEQIDGIAGPLDLTDRGATDAALAKLAGEVERIDILVNNAGIADAAPIQRMEDEVWDRIMEINATAPMRLARALVQPMIDAGWGRIINLASNAGLSGYSYTHAYCASKHALVGLTRSMAHELGRTGVTVNAVCPGWVRTDMFQAAIDRIVRTTGRTAEQAEKSLVRMNPQHRAVEPEEVAHVVAMLCADAAAGLHGQAIAVDGGQVMK